MTLRKVPFTLTIGALAFACGGKGDYAGAAVTAGIAVGAAALHRATLGGCWGQCTHGLVCDRRRGKCVRPDVNEGPPKLVRQVSCLPDEPCASDAGANEADSPLEGGESAEASAEDGG